MSFVVLNRTYAYDNPVVGTAAGQETNQAQFFPYTPGAVDPVSGYEGIPDETSNTRYIINKERTGNTSPGIMPYGLEIP